MRPRFLPALVLLLLIVPNVYAIDNTEDVLEGALSSVVSLWDYIRDAVEVITSTSEDEFGPTIVPTGDPEPEDEMGPTLVPTGDPEPTSSPDDDSALEESPLSGS